MMTMMMMSEQQQQQQKIGEGFGNLSFCWRITLVLTLVTCWSTTLLLYADLGDKSSGASTSARSSLSSLLLRGGGSEACSFDTGIVSATDAQQQPQQQEQQKQHQKLLVQYGDSIYLRGDWDAAPIVIESHKLVFFTSAKVACTVWKQLFRRMMGYSDWKVEEYVNMLPWNPETNGLKYLYDYSPERASEIMTSSNWTRAIFVREPKSRFLSAYLDKAFHDHGSYVRDKCCAYTGKCVEPARRSLEGFLQLAYYCRDAHWQPQSWRMEPKYWPYVNFVGQMDTLAQDAKRLLEKIGAWEQYGRKGWGGTASQNNEEEEAIFQDNSNDTNSHPTNAVSKLRTYFNTPEVIAKVESFYAEDYCNPVLNITRIVL